MELEKIEEGLQTALVDAEDVKVSLARLEAKVDGLEKDVDLKLADMLKKLTTLAEHVGGLVHAIAVFGLNRGILQVDPTTVKKQDAVAAPVVEAEQSQAVA